jgi:hypothetical protein
MISRINEFEFFCEPQVCLIPTLVFYIRKEEIVRCINKSVFWSCIITSVRASRDIARNETKYGYFEFKPL